MMRAWLTKSASHGRTASSPNHAGLHILVACLPIQEGTKEVYWNDVLLERCPFGFSKYQAEAYRVIRHIGRSPAG